MRVGAGGVSGQVGPAAAASRGGGLIYDDWLGTNLREAWPLGAELGMRSCRAEVCAVFELMVNWKAESCTIIERLWRRDFRLEWGFVIMNISFQKYMGHICDYLKCVRKSVRRICYLKRYVSRVVKAQPGNSLSLVKCVIFWSSCSPTISRANPHVTWSVPVR